MATERTKQLKFSIAIAVTLWKPQLVAVIPIFSVAVVQWMGIEPIHDGNGNDTKIIKIMPLPLQCERSLTPAKLGQSGRHASWSHEVSGSIPTGGNFFCWIYFALPYVDLCCKHCQICVITKKLDYNKCWQQYFLKQSCSPIFNDHSQGHSSITAPENFLIWTSRNESFHIIHKKYDV